MVHVVDSDQAISDGLTTLLGAYGIDVRSHRDAESFVRYWLPRRYRNGCLIAEADLPGISGLALLRDLRDLGVEIPVLLLVSTYSAALFEAAVGLGRVSVIQKPCLGRTLIDRVLGMRADGMAGLRQRRQLAGH